jgi:hypothetical protein
MPITSASTIDGIGRALATQGATKKAATATEADKSTPGAKSMTVSEKGRLICWVGSATVFPDFLIGDNYHADAVKSHPHCRMASGIVGHV